MYAERRSTRVPGVLWRSATRAGTSSIAPDGCMDIIWDGSAFMVAGPDTLPYLFETHRTRDLTAVRFAPGVAPGILGCPATGLLDQRPDLADLWPPHEVERWVEAMHVATDVGATLEDLAAARFRDTGGTPAWVAPVVAMAGDGAAATDIARRSGLSTRQLQRRATERFGYGVRTLGRVLRVQRASAALRAGRSVSDVAHEAGYADQAHLTRECRALLGSTPARLRAQATGAYRSTGLSSGSSTVA